MGTRDQSIKRKTTAVIMVTSVVVLLLTAAAFTAYDLTAYRRNLARRLTAVPRLPVNPIQTEQARAKTCVAVSRHARK